MPHPGDLLQDHAALAEKNFWVQGRRCFVREEHVPDFSAELIPAFSWMLAGRITGAAKGVRWPFAIIRRDTRQRGIIGCNMAFWRNDLVAVNGYDEDYAGWGTGEDSDVGTRLYHLGRRRKFVYGPRCHLPLEPSAGARGHPMTADAPARLADTIRQRKIRCDARPLTGTLQRKKVHPSAMSPATSMRKIRIDFCDFGCANVSKSNNYFYMLLSERFEVEICDQPDFLIYSCYGHEHRLHSGVKIFYSSESDPPDYRECDYSLACVKVDDPRQW